jgi:hypothetical protein
MSPGDLFGQQPAAGDSIGDKVAYVKGQKQTRNHTCHWPGCARQVPPAMWGCRDHWYALPNALRASIWRSFRPGQEVTLTPSAEYVAAAKAVQQWIAAQAVGANFEAFPEIR